MQKHDKMEVLVYGFQEAVNNIFSIGDTDFFQ